jgi:hypothetical protein
LAAVALLLGLFFLWRQREAASVSAAIAGSESLRLEGELEETVRTHASKEHSLNAKLSAANQELEYREKELRSVLDVRKEVNVVAAKLRAIESEKNAANAKRMQKDAEESARNAKRLDEDVKQSLSILAVAAKRLDAVSAHNSTRVEKPNNAAAEVSLQMIQGSISTRCLSAPLGPNK